jgi:hypothetical protein
MRRRPPFVQAFFALVVFWLAAGVSAGAASGEAGGVPGSVHRESVALSTPHVAIAGMATSRKASSPDWSSRLFLPSHAFAAREGDVAASSAFALFGLRDDATGTVTYDATAPPATLNTVR